MSDKKTDVFIESMLQVVREDLVGCTITAAVLDEDGENYGFEVMNSGRKRVVFVTMDPEGNGPGFLDIN
ncbi:MAG TPA: hypothetical protein ENK35_09465 [Candidatus Tenderia sp.]|nr:hypothetical protein [Candidatus Tenderia sp.]